MGDYERRNFLQACLLLLLNERPAHGYDLRGRLQPLRKGTDRAGVYRSLRELERDGLVESRWHTTEVGPPRRVYYITSKGVEDLAQQNDAVAGAHDELHAFLNRYALLRSRGDVLTH